MHANGRRLVQTDPSFKTDLLQQHPVGLSKSIFQKDLSVLVILCALSKCSPSPVASIRILSPFNVTLHVRFKAYPSRNVVILLIADPLS